MSLPSFQLLEALLAIAESTTLAEAAKKLGLTQPALSMQIKRLEAHFDLPIFEFQGKRKILTEYGKTIYEESKRLISQFSGTFESIDRRFANANKQTLRIAGRRELIQKAVKAISFEGTVSYSIMSSDQALKELQNRNIDIAISRIKPDSSELVAKEFLSNCPWLVVHEKWLPNETKNLVNNKDFFLRTPALVYNSQADLLKEWIQRLGLNIRQLNIKYICEDWVSILKMIEMGEGYSIIPDSLESQVKKVKHFNLPCSLVTSQTYYFLFHKNLRKFPAYRNLLS